MRPNKLSPCGSAAGCEHRRSREDSQKALASTAGRTVILRLVLRRDSCPLNRFLRCWIAGIVCGLGALSSPASEVLRPLPAAVSALGRLEPGDGLRHLAAPHSTQGPSIIGRLFVREGQWVTNGQPLAVTHNHAALEAAWRQAEASVELAKRHLAVVETGAKTAELAALSAELERARVEADDAGRNWRRSRQLRVEGSLVSAESVEQLEARFLALSNAVHVSEHRLAAGREVRPVDVAHARADVAVAEAAAERAHFDWQQTIIRAPADGEILRVHQREGEQVGTDGVADFGATDRMGVRAEVYESDVRRLKVGQKVEVKGAGFDGVLAGKVESIGRQVRSNRLLSPDPAEFADARVVEVWVRLDRSEPVAGLSGALVNVAFLP